MTGAVRQGALDSLVQEALAVAADVPAVGRPPRRDAGRLDGGRRSGCVRRRRRRAGRLRPRGGPAGAADARLQRSRRRGRAGQGRRRTEVAVDVKLDGIRIQVHRSGDDVLVVTRSLEDITARLPEVVEVARSLPATSFVLDGEALALDETGRPRPFQETASRTAMTGGRHRHAVLLRRAGTSTAPTCSTPPPPSAPLRSSGWCPADHRVPRLVTADPAAARGLPRADARLRPRGRGRQGPRRAVRRRPPRLVLGQGQARAHPRPGRARRRVGLRSPRGLALQHPPRRPQRATAAS